MWRKIKGWIRNKLLAHLFCAIIDREVLYIEQKQDRLYVRIKGERADEKHIRELRTQAKTLRDDLDIWQVLIEEMRYRASEKMYYKSISDEDIAAGKWMLYTLDIMDKKLEKIARLKIPGDKKKSKQDKSKRDAEITSSPRWERVP